MRYWRRKALKNIEEMRVHTSIYMSLRTRRMLEEMAEKTGWTMTKLLEEAVKALWEKMEMGSEEVTE